MGFPNIRALLLQAATVGCGFEVLGFGIPIVRIGLYQVNAHATHPLITIPSSPNHRYSPLLCACPLSV